MAVCRSLHIPQILTRHIFATTSKACTIRLSVEPESTRVCGIDLTVFVVISCTICPCGTANHSNHVTWSGESRRVLMLSLNAHSKVHAFTSNKFAKATPGHALPHLTAYRGAAQSPLMMRVHSTPHCHIPAGCISAMCTSQSPPQNTWPSKSGCWQAPDRMTRT